MTIPSMPGFDETVAPGLAKIAEAIHGIVNPYHRSEQDLKRAIQRDPRVANQLADMEYANPGSVGKVWGPGAENYAKALAPSVEARLNKKIGENVEGSLTDPKAIKYLTGKYLGFQPSDIGKESMLQQQVTNMEDLMANNPELAEDAAFNQFLGKTRTAYENEKAELSATRGAESFLTGRAAGLSPDQIMDAVLGKEVMVDGKPFKVNTREVGDLFQSPTYGNLFKVLFANKVEDQREALRLKLGNAQSHRSFLESLTLMMAGKAITRSNEVENTNPAAIAAAEYGMNHPTVTALGGITDPKDPGYDAFQKQVTEAKEARRREGAARDVSRVRAAQGNVITQQKLLGGMLKSGASDPEIQEQVNALNIALDEAGKLTGHVVQAAFTLDPERFFAGTKFDMVRNKGVYYFDETGNPIQEDSVPTYVAGTGAKELMVPPKKGESDTTATTITPAAGKTGTPETTTKGAVDSVGVSAKDIFPNIAPATAMQMDRVHLIGDASERKKHYEGMLTKNPNLTDEQKTQLKKLFKVE